MKDWTLVLQKIIQAKTEKSPKGTDRQGTQNQAQLSQKIPIELEPGSQHLRDDEGPEAVWNRDENIIDEPGAQATRRGCPPSNPTDGFDSLVMPPPYP